MFDSGSAELRTESLASLTELGRYLAGLKDRDVLVVGHATVAESGARGVDGLAMRRSLAIVKVLLGAGVAGERVGAASHGDRKKTAQPTRFEIVFLPRADEIPALPEVVADSHEG